jgi:hypothetical protein
LTFGPWVVRVRAGRVSGSWLGCSGVGAGGRNRWIVESCLSWLLRNRRLVRRYDRKAEHFQAFADLACTLLAHKRLTKATK